MAKKNNTAVDEAGTQAEVRDADKESAMDAFIASYAKAYPGEAGFYVTSDKQVFLGKDKGLAVLHQDSLCDGKNVEFVKVK